MTAPLPDNETERLAALRDYNILDTPPQEEYDDLVRLAAYVCDAPISAVSVVDADRQWFKAITGLAVTQTSRDAAFCAHTILGDDLLIVPDTQADPRFADNPLVMGDPRIRFYAGTPLVTEDGHALGSLCVIDTVPRQLTSEQQNALRALGRQARTQLELGRRLVQQERLAAEQKRLVAIIESSADSIASTDMEGRIVSWNAGAERLYGYAAQEIIGQSQTILVPPGETTVFASMVQTVVACGRLEGLEVVRRRKGGERIHVSVTLSAIRDASGQVIGVTFVGRDITERKKAEAALEAEREFNQAMLESLQEGIVACDADGTLTLFNRASREFHGLPEQPLPPEEWARHFDLYQADGLTLMRTQDIPLFRAFQGEKVRNAEMVIAPKDGPARFILATGQAIYGAGGKKLGAVAAMHDVTERRQVERELTRMAAIVESSEEAILAATLDGVLVNWNAGAERLYGYAASEMIGRNVSVLALPGQTSPVPAAVARLLRGEAVTPVEVERVHRDGTRFRASLAFSPLRDAAGAMIGLSCIARDVTARMEAEEALAKSSAALQESEARLRRLADAAFEGIAISQDGILVEVSPAYAAQLGYDSPADMVGVAVERIVAPESRALVRRKLAGCDELRYEVTLLRRDGTTFEAEVRGRNIQLGGRPARVTAVHDVSRHKALEKDLRERVEQLYQSEARLRALLENAPVILYAADADGTVTLSEGTGLAALGLKPGEAVGRSVFEFSGGDPEREAPTRRALAGESVSFDARVGGLCLHTELRPVRDAAGSVTGIIGVCFDLTERTLAEERFRVLFEQSSDAHLLCAGGGIIDCNNATLAMLRCEDKAQLLGTHPGLLSPDFQPDGRRSAEAGLEMDVLAHERGSHHFEWTHRRMDGENFPTEVWLTPVALASGPAMLAVLHDLTERKRAEEQIRDHAIVLEFQKEELEKANAELAALATTDGLTGLYNHRAFQERLAEEAARAARYGTPLSLILLDVDRFKQFNDKYGHPEGDSILKAVAHVLQAGARDTDLVARYGGEEFVLLLPQTDLGGATALAERLRAAVEDHSWRLQAVTASFGVADLRLGEDGSDLIARADEAMYRAKADGRNRVIPAAGLSATSEPLRSVAVG